MANFFKKLFGKSEEKVETNTSVEAPKTALVAVATGDLMLEEAHRRGCKMDGWSECFSLEKWLEMVQLL